MKRQIGPWSPNKWTTSQALGASPVRHTPSPPIPSPTRGTLPLTRQPIVTGTSVLGLKFKDGIMLTADTLASYGSLAQIRDMERLAVVGDAVVGASGDMSDWQELQHVLGSLM